MKVNLRRVKKVVKVYTHIKGVIFMKGNGSKVKIMEKGLTLT